jgi:iron complex outermembrane receptor protein
MPLYAIGAWEGRTRDKSGDLPFFILSNFRDKGFSMKQLCITISSVFFLCATSLYAQLDSTQQLDEVLLFDTKLNNYSEGFRLLELTDSIAQNNSSLTDVLRYNTSIYFKENGYGMVSSPSFRGTNASQTSVIWNGIPINSNLNGQTDFNTIAPQSFDNIIVRSGGGSVQYGSGAIGGSIHLNDQVSFKKKKATNLRLNYGSFLTVAGDFKTRFSTDMRQIGVSVNFINSRNDYKYKGTEKSNTNGEYLRFNASATTAFKYKNSVFNWNSNFFYGDRNFSSSLTAPSNDNYENKNTRNLISWSVFSKRYVSTLKIAHLFEGYRYFANKETSSFTEGESSNFIGDYALDYNFSKNIKFGGNINFTRIEGGGSSFADGERNTLSAVLLLKHQATKTLSYGLNLRQEFLNDFENPFLFSIDGKLQVNPWYALKLNGSKNYRVPTFNDLYWNAGGNIDLHPETSLQAEVGNVVTFKNFQIDTSAFYVKSKDLIQWRPNQNGIWTPLNVSKVINYGVEITTSYQRSIGDNNVEISGNYAYTKAIDSEKKKQLIYVPFHKATGQLSYGYKSLAVSFQSLFTGRVFTTSDNKGTVDSYTVSNLGAEYTLNTNGSPITLGVKVDNFFNKFYENVDSRPMPGRNLKTFLNLKF